MYVYPSEGYVQWLKSRLCPKRRTSKPASSMKKNQRWPGASQTFPVVPFPPGTKTRSARLLGSRKAPRPSRMSVQRYPGASQTFPVVSFPPGTKTRSARLLGSGKAPEPPRPMPMGYGGSPYTPHYAYPAHVQPSPGGYNLSPYGPPSHMHPHHAQYGPYGGGAYDTYSAATTAATLPGDLSQVPEKSPLFGDPVDRKRRLLHRLLLSRLKDDQLAMSAATDAAAVPAGESGGGLAMPPYPASEIADGSGAPRPLQITRKISTSMPSLRPPSTDLSENGVENDDQFISYLREQSGTIQLQLPALDDSETVDFEHEANMVRKMSRSMSGMLSAKGHMMKPSEEYVQRLKSRLYSTPQPRTSKPASSMKKNQRWPGASQTFPVVSFAPGTKTRSARLLGSGKAPGPPRPMPTGYGGSPYTPHYSYPTHGQPSPGGYNPSPYGPPSHVHPHHAQYSPYGGGAYPYSGATAATSPGNGNCAIYTGIVVNQWDADAAQDGKGGILSQIWARLVEAGMMSVCARLRGREVSMDEVLAVHSQEYAKLVMAVAEEKSPDEVNKITTARTAAGCVLEMALAVARNELKNGFALVRPCGRRAQADTPSDVDRFSLNNIAITVAALRRAGIRHFVIIDWNVEYSDSTQRIFYEDPNVLCISVHRLYHPDEGRELRLTGRPTEKGAGAGEGYNINVPWPREAKPGDAEYVYFVRHVATPLIEAFQPDIVLVASGFTAAKGEADGFGVTPLGFAHMTRMLAEAAKGRVVYALEDGEVVPVVSECVLASLRALAGDTPPPLPGDAEKAKPSKGLLQVLEDAVESHVVPFPEVLAATRRQSVASAPSDMRGSASYEPGTPATYHRVPDRGPGAPYSYGPYRSPYVGHIDTAENTPVVRARRKSGMDEALSPRTPDAPKTRSVEADMAESAAEALASLSVMATQHSGPMGTRPEYPADDHSGAYPYGGHYYGGYGPPAYPGGPPHHYAQPMPHDPYYKEGYPYPTPYPPGPAHYSGPPGYVPSYAGHPPPPPGAYPQYHPHEGQAPAPLKAETQH